MTPIANLTTLLPPRDRGNGGERWPLARSIKGAAFCQWAPGALIYTTYGRVSVEEGRFFGDMKVSLRMYALEGMLPHLEAFSRAVEQGFMEEAAAAGRGLEEEAGPLTLSQTCGWPLVSEDRGRQRVVAVPCYVAPGCQGPGYSSAIVVRRRAAGGEASGDGGKDSMDRLLEAGTACRMAINSPGSCSGHLMPAVWMGAEAYARLTSDAVGGGLWTGSHVESCRAVADCRADVAGIDCVTLELIRQAEENLTDNCLAASSSMNQLFSTQ